MVKTAPLHFRPRFGIIPNAPNDGAFNPPTFGEAARGRKRFRPLHFQGLRMKTTVVYIDGSNLYYGQLRGSVNKWLDSNARPVMPRSTSKPLVGSVLRMMTEGDVVISAIRNCVPCRTK